jgi:mannose-6-phosphate isomerase-like protein (cupin superfamily)/pyrroloquinoline quinone (PQQ) biosynthesis protein C
MGSSSRVVTQALSPLARLEELKKRQAEHPFWSNSLFKACRAGSLTRDDFQFVFSQYSLYSRNFTRYLNGLMANCDNDLLRARLGENLWEEGGGSEPEQRHAEIFRRFLREGLAVDLERIELLDFTRYFVREYLDFCLKSSAVRSSAFLSLGTEGIVARMYGVFVEGLKQAGVEEEHLEFFRIHMACDDAHALTLEEMMLSYATDETWSSDCELGMETALELRRRFFENLFQELQRRRVQGVLDRIQARTSLTPTRCEPAELRFSASSSASGQSVYDNENERLNIEFYVTRAPFPAEVLDPRFVRIPEGKFNENHKHAHETVFVVMQGTGEIHVDGRVVEVRPGDLVFVPRWSMHQSRNTGSGELLLLAIADFGLTGKAYIGDYLKTARMKNGAPQVVIQTP